MGLPLRAPEFQGLKTPAHAKSATAEACQTISIGKVSGLQQDEGHFYATAVIAKGKDRLKFATVSCSKERLESWMATAPTRPPPPRPALPPRPPPPPPPPPPHRSA